MNRFDLQDKTDEEVKELADKGEWIGIFDYGLRMVAQDRYEEAFKYLYQIKDSNNFFVWEQLINIAYYEIPGIMSDEELIELLFRRHNYGTSSYDYILAYCYEKGRGVEKDLAKYNEYLAICAEDGSSFATLELAHNYEVGYGVEVDLKKAYDLYLNYHDEHFKKDYRCEYQVAYYMLHELGGAKRNYSQIEYHLSYAARVLGEARELYREIFKKDPAVDFIEMKRNFTIVGSNFTGEVKNVREASRAIIIENDELLVSYEKNTNQYMIPGGGNEENEDNISCVKRELEEETGYLIEPGELVLTIDEYYEDCRYISHYYLAKVVGKGTQHLSERELEVGMVPLWKNVDEMIDIFSPYKNHEERDEMRRGLYFREYWALVKSLNKKVTWN